ncbi:MAG: glycosyltransferase family 4 protein [Methanosarcinales archaeon]
MRKFDVLLLVPYFCAGGKGKSSPALGGYEPVSFGGTDLSTLSLAEGLKRRGHNVYVMFADSGLPEEFSTREIPYILAPVDKRNPWGIFIGACHIKKFVTKNKIKIIHSQTVVPTFMACLAKLITKRVEFKIIWHCRGIKHCNYALVGHLLNSLIDFVITNSDFARKKVIKGGFLPKKVKTAYNCLNFPFPDRIEKNRMLMKELGITKDIYVIGTVSRLDLDRGVEYFLQAAALVKNNLNSIKFLIVGGGPCANVFLKQAHDLGIKEDIIFLGARRDVGRVYSILDVFVNPCPLDTGTGNTNAEAMAFAKPVIACNSGGAPELVQDNITGILVPPENPKKLAEAILYLLRNRERAGEMGLGGRKVIKNYFTQERLIQEIEEIYYKLLNDS